MSEGKLVVCPTPLGNLGDMTDRARKALEAADTVCAEDTRVTGRLLAAFGIEKRLERLDESLLGERAGSIVQRVLAGETIAYCSDAGMPGVSDPGLRLVRVAREAGATVEVLPGPTAVATAYVASGCDSPRFYFGGFFPRKDVERRSLLESLASLDAALIFYESPNRIVSALGVLAEVFPQREVAVCRELTKLHEEVLRGRTADIRDMFVERADTGAVRGEIVLVIDAPSSEENEAGVRDAEAAASVRTAELREAGYTRRDIARTLVEEFGIARNVAYDLALNA